MGEDINKIGKNKTPVAVTNHHLKPLWDCLASIRKSDFSGDSRRLLHGRGGTLSGLEWCCLDRHSQLLQLILFQPPPEDFFEKVLQALPQWFNDGGIALLVQRRYIKGAPVELLAGEWPINPVAVWCGLRFRLDFKQQNNGFFLDMSPGRDWLNTVSADKKVLNLFSYTCALSVVAISAGAASVFNVDMSKRALSWGRDNHRLNNLDNQRTGYLSVDILKSWSRIRKPGPYDIIIFDPPSAQKGSFIASRDYIKLVRRLPELAAPGAKVMACLNDPALDVNFLQDMFSEEASGYQLIQQLPASADFPDVSANGGLKILIYENTPKMVK